jgi:hypothetical protein
MNIRVSASSQIRACNFAERLLPYLRDKMAKPPRVAAVCSPEVAAALSTPLVRFIPINEWRLQDAQKIIQSLYNNDVTVLILSEEYVHSASASAEVPILFENGCTDHGINIIQVEQYDETGLRYFGCETEWRNAELASILGIMFDDYRKEPLLCAPWGGVPYFIIEPDNEKNSKSVRLLAGFQAWSYEHLPDEYVPDKYLFTHWTPVEHMTHSKKMGPVPFMCR